MALLLSRDSIDGDVLADADLVCDEGPGGSTICTRGESSLRQDSPASSDSHGRDLSGV